MTVSLLTRTQRRVFSGLSVLALAGAGTFAAVPAVQAAARPHNSNANLPSPHLIRPRPHGAAPNSPITGPLINNGGPVETAPQVYVVFWDWASDPSGEQPYLDSFLSSVGGTSWLSTVNEYGGGSAGGLLAGTWNDPSPIPASPSDADIQAEAASAASHFNAGNSVNAEIVVATPTGHSTPGFGQSFCAYHGAVGADPNITYTNLPYMTDAGGSCGEDSVNGANGTLDGVSVVEGHELAETITDPFVGSGWVDATGNEIADKCAWFDLSDITTSAGKFAVQPLWSNNANGCVDSPGKSAAQVTLQYDTGATSPTTNQIEPNFELTNNGTAPVSLSDIVVRYWFTEDGTQPMSFACDFAPIGCSHITGDINTTSLGGQDHYLALGFTSGAGTLAPGQSTGVIQTRFWQNNFANMNQVNDWSWNGADTTLNANFQITVYQDGNLISGEEP
jgi:cellulose binding protein with CBM3 domain